jgi:hypothetical protein
MKWKKRRRKTMSKFEISIRDYQHVEVLLDQAFLDYLEDVEEDEGMGIDADRFVEWLFGCVKDPVVERNLEAVEDIARGHVMGYLAYKAGCLNDENVKGE